MADLKRVSAQEAKQLVDDGYTYLDVRTEAEYAAGHPVGAQNVPFMLAGPAGLEPNPEYQRVVEALFGKDAKLVVGCKSGGRSVRAVKSMLEAGYTHVVDVRPGYGGKRNPFGGIVEQGWEGEGLPTEATTEGGTYEELKQRVQ